MSQEKIAKEKIDAFFYGLYMDADLLRSLNIKPENPRVARVDGYRLDLRGAVKALPQEGERVWGIIFRLPQEDLDKMYGGPKTKLYKREEMLAVTEDGQAITVGCYNQPEDSSAAFNSEYCDQLIPAMRKAGLPSEYIDTIHASRG